MIYILFGVIMMQMVLLFLLANQTMEVASKGNDNSNYFDLIARSAFLESLMMVGNKNAAFRYWETLSYQDKEMLIKVSKGYVLQELDEIYEALDVNATTDDVGLWDFNDREDLVGVRLYVDPADMRQNQYKGDQC